ncbi:hypothetical protein OIU79_030130 [Salix purpurea]|uniref:Uncharacterized protein n=1 Tax=Salix purpurea TaxID=77065 RepID=A0A9Q0ZWA7_SALPP|nr:hypothetical protein OIU79_030130 [Salix purpurea]
MKVCREEERGEEEGIEWIKDLSVHFEDLALRSSFVAEERNSCGDEFLERRGMMILASSQWRRREEGGLRKR